MKTESQKSIAQIDNGIRWVNIIGWIMVFGIIIMFILTAGCTAQSEGIPNQTVTLKIYSLDRDTAVSGRFILGSGSVNSYPVYYFQDRLSNGGYKLRWIRSSDCTIFYDENDSPYIRATYQAEHDVVAPTSAYGIVGDDSIALKYGEQHWKDYEGTPIVITLYGWYERVGDAEIHIPENSLKREYTP